MLSGLDDAVMQYSGLLDYSQKPKLLFAFVASGNAKERHSFNKLNVDELLAQNKSLSEKYDMDCLIFSWARYGEEPEWLHEMERNSNNACQVRRIPGYNYVYFVKSLLPDMLKVLGYKYLTLHMDDVGFAPPHGNVSMLRLLDTVERHELTMLSPSVPGSSHQALLPQPLMIPSQIGRFVTSIEVQSLTLRVDAWECFWELYDVQYPSGWGADVWFYDYCVKTGRVPMKSAAVLDDMFVIHNPHNWESSNNKGRDPGQMFMGQVKAWKKQRRITLIKTELTSLGPLIN